MPSHVCYAPYIFRSIFLHAIIKAVWINFVLEHLHMSCQSESILRVMQLQWFLLTSVTLVCCAHIFFTLANSAKKITSADQIEFEYVPYSAQCFLGQSEFTFQILASDTTAAYQAIINFNLNEFDKAV